MISVPIKKIGFGLNLSLPSYATEGSAGMDLLAAIQDPLALPPLSRHLVPTGISIALPLGYEAQVRPRSGLALKNGITVLNAPGTIDSDYRGEISVILINLGQENYIVTQGQRIAQLIISPVSFVTWSEQNNLSSSTRQDGGFGSTGT
ncbi:MAG: dUTP diphosphatase [Alphaproteobacteria bacterium]|nr:dUTP diphosphatase [Alphaproteobacteria bacterium]